MARRGDGLYLRGKVWYLDFRHDGMRHVVKLGKNISRTVAGASTMRSDSFIDPYFFSTIHASQNC